MNNQEHHYNKRKQIGTIAGEIAVGALGLGSLYLAHETGNNDLYTVGTYLLVLDFFTHLVHLDATKEYKRWKNTGELVDKINKTVSTQE